jgi:colicin import membrane protein
LTAAAAQLGAYDALHPRSPGGMAPGAALAALVHVGLITALSFGVNWRLPPPQVVAAELWAAVPQIAAPRAMEPETAPPAPSKPVEKAAPPPPAPALPDAQIAIEKAKKEKAAKDEKVAKDEKAALDKASRERVEKADKAKADARTAREAAELAVEDARVNKQREENLRRMMGQIASAPGSTRGTANADAAPSATYTGKLVNAIFPNIIFTESFTGNPAAEVEVRSAPNGSIMGWRIVTPSGNKEWDDAVLKAIERTRTLPRDTDGRVPSTLTITFRPSKR